ADQCEAAEVPLISAAVGRFDGSITTLRPFQENEDGELLPRYRDIFPAKPPEGTVPSCAEAGIIGALTGIIGSMQALEIVKEITNTGESLVGRLVLYDARSARFDTVQYMRGK
ncbi:MAG: ThiF family adenylyltransferase, partial [Rhizobiaceae bacterium]